MSDKASRLSADEYTIAEHNWKTADRTHILYVQEWGNPKGTPILFLHGGPGSGCHDGHKLLFDPQKHYVVFHDQRGCGHSTPANSLKENNTQKLLDDIQMITEKLSLDSFAIFGRSWGSTLGLCYAIDNPEKVTNLVIGGVFLGTQEEVDWVDKGKFSIFFPEIAEHADIASPSSRDYAQMALATLRLDDRYPIIGTDDWDNEVSKIERAYLENRCFLPENFILKNAHKIACPVSIVQGRYDMMTPPKFAYKLSKALPASSMQWTIAGHSSSDRANFDVSKAILSQL